jgi:RNA polymerase sigma factor (sigma-70 family)
MDKTEESLQAFLSGNRDGIGSVITVYQQELLQFALVIALRSDIAEDAVTDAFLALWAMAGQFNNADHIRNFLYKAVRNLCWSGNRRVRRHASIPEDEAGMADTDVLSELDALESDILREMILREIHTRIGQLPSPLREDLLAHVFGGKSFVEIAGARGEKANSVGRAVRRAMEEIRDDLKFP